MYNGALQDATLWSTRNDVRPDLEKLKAIIRAGRPMICFHNHPDDGGRAAMFPSDEDFEVAALVSSMTYTQDPSRTVDFRIVQLGEEQDTVVSYGFKGSAREDIKETAHLGKEAFIDYLQHVRPAVPLTTESEACRTHPEYFLWPSDRFFIHHRAP